MRKCKKKSKKMVIKLWVDSKENNIKKEELDADKMKKKRMEGPDS